MHRSDKQDQPRPAKWIEDRYQRNCWKTNDGRKICLQDEVCLCVTTLEDDFMRRNAVVKLANCGIFIHYATLNRNHQARHPIASFFEEQETSVFGVPLEKAYRIEKQLHHYPKVRINSHYKSHIPHFFLATVKSIAENGISGINILHNEGRTLQTSMVGYTASNFKPTLSTTSQMQQQLRLGLKLVYDSKENSTELSMLMRIFLRDLSEGLLTPEMEVFFGYVVRFNRLSAQLEVLQYLIQVLPRANREVLFLVISLCRKILFVDKNECSFRKMVSIFTRLIFRSEYRINGVGHSVVKIMIKNVDSIFTLNAATLCAIYKQIDLIYPKKLDALLQRRVGQDLWNGSDIPNALWILTHQGRSFELISLERYIFANKREKKRQELNQDIAETRL